MCCCSTQLYVLFGCRARGFTAIFLLPCSFFLFLSRSLANPSNKCTIFSTDFSRLHRFAKRNTVAKPLHIYTTTCVSACECVGVCVRWKTLLGAMSWMVVDIAPSGGMSASYIYLFSTIHIFFPCGEAYLAPRADLYIIHTQSVYTRSSVVVSNTHARREKSVHEK